MDKGSLARARSSFLHVNFVVVTHKWLPPLPLTLFAKDDLQNWNQITNCLKLFVCQQNIMKVSLAQIALLVPNAHVLDKEQFFMQRSQIIA